MSVEAVEQAFAPTTTTHIRVESEGTAAITVDWNGVNVSQIQDMAARYVVSRTRVPGKGADKRERIKLRSGLTLRAVDFLPRGTFKPSPVRKLLDKIKPGELSEVDREALRALLGDK